VPWFDHFVTAPAQTAIDLAACLPFTGGVAASDQAIWSRRPGGALATTNELSDAAERYSGRAHARVRRVASFAQPGADSVRESQSRVLIAHLGFPEPELQHRFILGNGRVVYSDFWWERHSHVGEFDGLGKYLDPELLNGRTPEEALIEEKDRADALRREVGMISRWRTPALTSPRRLYAWDAVNCDRPRVGGSERSGLPADRKRLALFVARRGLQPDAGPLAELRERAGTGIRERGAHARGDHVDQVLQARP
jgi:hypothetical protein